MLPLRDGGLEGGVECIAREEGEEWRDIGGGGEMELFEEGDEAGGAADGLGFGYGAEVVDVVVMEEAEVRWVGGGGGRGVDRCGGGRVGHF